MGAPVGEAMRIAGGGSDEDRREGRCLGERNEGDPWAGSVGKIREKRPDGGGRDA